jgi:hypothetical protein
MAADCGKVKNAGPGRPGGPALSRSCPIPYFAVLTVAGGAMRRVAIAACLYAGLLAATPALANDTAAERALGGLTFSKNDAISMDSEDLFLSKNIVRVKYRFANRSDAPVDLLVAFPLPDIPPATEGEDSGYWSDPVGGLKFRTTIDGAAVPLDVVEQAWFDGADVGARLKGLGVPLNRFAENFSTAINRLPKADREKLLAGGMIRSDGEANEPLWAGLWTLKTTITRRQIFPAQKTVLVEHQYAPILGGSVGGGLDPQYRRSSAFAAERAKFCIEPDWLRSFDSKAAKRKNSVPPYSEIWLGYVLKTGANWAGPIGDFRLVVDKGAADSLVSFCGDGVKKISATQFEMRRTNFTPTRDLDVLIVEYPNAE